MNANRLLGVAGIRHSGDAGFCVVADLCWARFLDVRQLECL